jgi:hypothetical protein
MLPSIDRCWSLRLLFIAVHLLSLLSQSTSTRMLTNSSLSTCLSVCSANNLVCIENDGMSEGGYCKNAVNELAATSFVNYTVVRSADRNNTLPGGCQVEIDQANSTLSYKFLGSTSDCSTDYQTESPDWSRLCTCDAVSTRQPTVSIAPQPILVPGRPPSEIVRGDTTSPNLTPTRTPSSKENGQDIDARSRNRGVVLVCREDRATEEWTLAFVILWSALMAAFLALTAYRMYHLILKDFEDKIILLFYFALVAAEVVIAVMQLDSVDLPDYAVLTVSCFRTFTLLLFLFGMSVFSYVAMLFNYVCSQAWQI